MIITTHRRHAEWTPSRIVRWAEQTGPAVAALVAAIMASRPHPEQGFRSCLGIMRLGRRHGDARLEAAAARALAVRALSYRSVESILKSGLDGLPPPGSEPPRAERHHELPARIDDWPSRRKTWSVRPREGAPMHKPLRTHPPP